MYKYIGGRERGTSTPQARPTPAGERFELRIVFVHFGFRIAVVRY